MVQRAKRTPQRPGVLLPEGRGARAVMQAAVVALGLALGQMSGQASEKATSSAGEKPSASEKSAQLLGRCRPIDLHADTAWQVRKRPEGKRAWRCGQPLQADPLSLGSLRYGAQVYAVWTRPGREDGVRAARAALAAIGQLARCGLVRADARRLADPSGVQPMVIVAIEGGEALAGRAEALRAWGREGLLSVAPTWNKSNEFADAARGLPLHRGLSQEGRKLVRIAGEMGVLLDVSHASDATARQILASSRLPVLATHSNARAVVDHARNLPDDLIAAIAHSGGVIGLNAHCPFAAGRSQCTTADLVRQVQHVRQVGGDAVLALGLDFDGDIQAPSDLRSVRQLPNLVDALLAAGLPEPVVCGLLGDNVRTLVRKLAATTK